MGQSLSEPVTTKDSSSVQNERYRVGSSCMQGWRVTMEDWHTHILALPGDSEAAFFAVYDGHGGPRVAHHAGTSLHSHITSSSFYPSCIPSSLRSAFLSFDKAMMADPAFSEELSGTTAVTVLIRQSSIYCANVGDSRAVASVRGQAFALSNDHKPGNPAELARIVKAGGWVEFNRVNGNLALSRALGDFVFKRNSALPQQEQMVSPEPEIIVRDKDGVEFIVLACDGIWDVLSSQEAIEFVRRRLGLSLDPEQICEELMSACLAPDCQMGGLGCDNMTVILVCLLDDGEDYAKYCARIAASLSNDANDVMATATDDDEEEDEDDVDVDVAREW